MLILSSILLSASLANAPASSSFFAQVSVPFGCGLSFPVSQAHAVGTHLENDTWAWDFRMPEGTPIVAARDGVVRMARGDSTVGGCDARFAPYANYVVIDHLDGLETQYLHFQRVVVKPGERVRAGDLLGYSGKTGWACGAHLHFKVARVETNGWNNPSVPAEILGYGDPQEETLISSSVCSVHPAQVAERSQTFTKPHLPVQPAAAPKPALPALGGTGKKKG